MALHLIPDEGVEHQHEPNRNCWCGPDLVEVPVEHDDQQWSRQAWQHRGSGDLEGVEVVSSAI